MVQRSQPISFPPVAIICSWSGETAATALLHFASVTLPDPVPAPDYLEKCWGSERSRLGFKRSWLSYGKSIGCGVQAFLGCRSPHPPMAEDPLRLAPRLQKGSLRGKKLDCPPYSIHSVLWMVLWKPGAVADAAVSGCREDFVHGSSRGQGLDANDAGTNQGRAENSLSATLAFL